MISPADVDIRTLPATARAQLVYRLRCRLLAQSIPLPAVFFIMLGLKLKRGDFLAVDRVSQVNEWHKCRAGAVTPAGYQAAAIMTQLVPSSQTSVANLPAVAAKMAVPAVPEFNGLTLDDAEITV